MSLHLEHVSTSKQGLRLSFLLAILIFARSDHAKPWHLTFIHPLARSTPSKHALCIKFSNELSGSSMQATLPRARHDSNSSSRWGRAAAHSGKPRPHLTARAVEQIKVRDTCMRKAGMLVLGRIAHTQRALATGRGRGRPSLAPCRSAMGQ